MEEDLFSDPFNKLVSYVRSFDDPSNINNDSNNSINGNKYALSLPAVTQDLAQFLWSQKRNFSDRLCRLRPKSSQANESEARRNEIKTRKQFIMKGDIIEVVDDFIQIAFQLSDKLNIDEYLACQVLAHVLNLTSERDNTQLLLLCEEYVYQTRSCYLNTLKEILSYLNSEIDKSKRDILQMFICELLVSSGDDSNNLVSILLKLFDQKIQNITVPTNQKEFKYRIIECQKIVECLYLICFQFIVKEESIKAILLKLKECSKLFSNQQIDTTLYHQLFQITFTLLLTIFVLFEEPKVILMNPIEKKPTTNSCLSNPTFLATILNDISNEWEHNLSIQSSLITLYYIFKLKSEGGSGVENDYKNRAFPKDRNGMEFLLKVVEYKDFKNSSLRNLYQFILDDYACSIVEYFPITTEKNNQISFLNNFNNYLVSIYKDGETSSKRFWECCENNGYLKSMWMQIPNGLIVSSFHLMASLSISNGIEVYNFFTKDSSQFTWNKIIQHLQIYVDALNQPNTEISPADTEALNAILCLITETISYAPQLAQMLARNVQLVFLFFRFITSPVSVSLKSTTLRAIAACARYPNYVPDIWKLLIDSKIFPAGLRMESQSSEHGEFPFTQQFLELFYQLLQVSPFLFDRTNDNTLRQYLDHIMELFQSFNNKAFNHILDKWRFTLTILNIFMYCLNQFKSTKGVENRVIDRRHPVYPLYAEVTKMSHHHTLQTIVSIIVTAAAASDNQDDQELLGVQNDLFQNTLERCLEIILFVSDSNVFGVEDAKSIVTQLSSAPATTSPIIAIAKLVDHENRDIGLKALRLIYSFEVYTQRISSLFLASTSPDSLLERFVRVLECVEHESEMTNHRTMSHNLTPYLDQEEQFTRYAKNSIQWTIAQLILYCIDKNSSTGALSSVNKGVMSSSSSNSNKYTIGHFLLGCPSVYDLSIDFEKHSRTCLTVILRKVSDIDFVTRFPHLNDCYHQIIYCMVSTPATTKPMINFLPLSYFKENIALLKSCLQQCRNEKLKDAHISSLSWLLKTMATTMHCGSDPLIKNYFMSLLVGGDGRGGNNNNYNSDALEILQVFNAIEFEFTELQKPPIFEMIPLLESSCLVNYRDCQIINLPLVRTTLEQDGRFTNAPQEIARELETCSRLNTTITLIDSKTRALEGWKLFLNEALLQVDTLISMNETIPLTLVQRLVMEFSNEKYPITCGISLGYTILTLFYVLTMKKDTYQLSSNFNDILESKVKGIFEGLIQTILRSSYQPIRGIAYTCIIKYLRLTHSFEQLNKSSNLTESGTTPSTTNIKSIEKHNILLLNKVDERFLRVLISDCHSFNGGWKIAAISCLELLVSLDGLRSNKTLKALDDRNAIVSIISQCTGILQRWEKLDARDIRVYDSQMSLLTRVAQNIDGIRLLMASNVVAAFSSCSSFLSHVPSDLTPMSPYASLIIPLLRLLVSLFNFPHERVDIYTQVQSLMAEHSDLFKFILQDAHPPSNTSLTILQLTVHLFSQNSKLIAQNYQSDKSQSQSHFNRFHYSILALFNKYSKPLKSKIKEDRDESQDEDDVNYLNSIDFTNQKEQPTIFDVEMTHLITLICRDIILYCRRVSIIQNSKFGSICFGSIIKSTLLSGNGNGSSQSTVLPTLDVAIKYMKECLVSYSKSLEIIDFLKQSIDNVDNLSNYQLKQILNDEQSYYQDLEVSQRNQMVIKKLNERLVFRYYNSDLLRECIETLLLVIVTHAYHYTVSVQGLFMHALLASTSTPTNTSPLLTSSAPSQTPTSLLSSSFVSPVPQLQQSTLNLNDLSSSTFNNNYNYNTNTKPLTSQDIFLNNDQQQQQQQSSTGKFMSSVFSYLKGMGGVSKDNNSTNNNNFQSSMISTTSSPMITSFNNTTNSSLLKSMIQQQQEGGTLSPIEAKEFLTKLWTSFDTEVPAFHKRLFDCLHSMPNKTLMIELLIKKLQDIFK